MPPRSTKAPYSVMFLTTPLTTLPSLRVSRVLVFMLVALLLEEHAAREHDVAALLVELDDLELVGLPDELVEVADRPEVDLRAGEERLHAAADGDREAALHALADGPFDELVALARGRDLVPDLHLVGLLLGKHDEAVVVLAALDVDVDRVAGLDRGLALRVGELVEGDDALALAADVDDDVVALHGDDRAFDDLAFFAEVAGVDAGFEERAKLSAELRGCSVVLPAELRAVVVVDMWLEESSTVRGACEATRWGWMLARRCRGRTNVHAPRAERNSLRAPSCQRGNRQDGCPAEASESGRTAFAAASQARTAFAAASRTRRHSPPQSTRTAFAAAVTG